MGKGFITISVPNNITQDEIKEIRQQFKQDPIYKHYKLNILISGYSDMKIILTDFLRNKSF